MPDLINCFFGNSTQHGTWSAAKYPYQTSRHQAGFTLLELIISSALGLVLFAAILNAYMSTKDSFLLNGAKTELYSESRATLRIVSRAIEHAGYRNMENVIKLEPEVFPAQGDFKENQVLIARSLGGNSWLLSTRFQSDGDELTGDCLGESHAKDVMVTHKLTYDADELTLTCERSCTDSAGASACTTQEEIISTQLRAIELLVGSTSTPNGRVVENYELIQNLTVSPDNILSIKAMAWFESTRNVLDTATEQNLNAFSDTITMTDRKLRVTVTDTFVLRNRLP